ncbi:MAG: hypothetical protein E6G35_06555 [Actinobacteria bacterium]|nr:MAG: hypothetical protein E6G35_06555 [Actinomycetota bacterium]
MSSVWDGRHSVELTEPVELGDPFADDLSEQLAARAPRRYTNKATVLLVGVVLLVGGFLGGVQVEKHFGTAAASPTTFPSGFRNASGGGGTTGTVKLVDGSTVYVTLANGDVVIVHTTANTTVTQAGSVKDLTAGATVTVTGQTGSDGSMTATRIVKTR